jgi:hypothetical protein
MQVPSTLKLIRFIKENTDAKIVCGGNHVAVEQKVF